MRILITICARSGSKGLPHKNIKPLNGSPLLHYSIRMAQNLQKHIEGEVFIELSTDSDKIKEIATEAGLTTHYSRPDELASDHAGKVAVIEDVYKYSQDHYSRAFDYVIDLDVSAPMRTQEDVLSAFHQLKNTPQALNIFSVSPARKNPYFNMVEKSGEDNFVHLVKAKGEFLGRQAAPSVYEMNASFYIYTKEFFRKGCSSAITDRSLAFVMDHSSFDIDNYEDFRIMEVMLQEGMIDFDFGQLPA